MVTTRQQLRATPSLNHAVTASLETVDAVLGAFHYSERNPAFVSPVSQAPYASCTSRTLSNRQAPFETGRRQRQAFAQNSQATLLETNATALAIDVPPVLATAKKQRTEISPGFRKASSSITLADIEEAASGGCSTTLPKHFFETWEGILQMRCERNAPVDTMGCDRLADQTSDPPTQRFHHLVAVFLSSQTADRSTAACMERLKAFGLHVDTIAASSIETLTELLYGVSFHKTKARNLKTIASILKTDYGGDIPPTFELLCKLPGVGPKMALIAMRSAWGRTEGIAVDVHVHRIANRLGWISTKTPEETCLALARVVPRKLWHEMNEVLVGFGQQRCKALRPLCTSCLVQQWCPAARVFLKMQKALAKAPLCLEASTGLVDA